MKAEEQKKHWAALESISEPKALQLAIATRQVEDDKVMRNGEELATRLRRALGEEEDEYSRLLQQQSMDTGEMLQMLTRQIQEVEGVYAEELRTVEAALRAVTRYPTSLSHQRCLLTCTPKMPVRKASPIHLMP